MFGIKTEKSFKRRNNIRYKVLDVLNAGAEITETLAGIFLTDRITSYRRAREAVYGRDVGRYPVFSKQKFYTLLNHLKREGLVEKEKAESGTLWQITGKGKRMLSNFYKQKQYVIPSYEKSKSPVTTIIIFDIPERERWKRFWLRTALLSLDFSLLQKSAWIGKNKIPERFIKDLDERKMLNYVHIFEVTKKGTLFSNSKV